MAESVLTARSLEEVLDGPHASPLSVAEKLDQTLMIAIEHQRQEGRDEGRSEAVAESRTEMLLRQLATRFGPFPCHLEPRRVSEGPPSPTSTGGPKRY